MTLIKKANSDKVLVLRTEKKRLENEIEAAQAQMASLQDLILNKKVALNQVVGELELLAGGEEQGMLF